MVDPATVLADSPVPARVAEWCAGQRTGPVVGRERLEGGAVSICDRLSTATGRRLVLKQTTDPPADLYVREAEGLATLHTAGYLRTPVVHLVGADLLLLEDLGSAPVAEDAWTDLGRSLARQHREVTAPRFGWSGDNYLGRLEQHNLWTADGHEFFARHRMLRWLDTPGCSRALTAADRAAVERLAGRLPGLIPRQPASLLHGDLWHANVIGTPDGAAVIDPAVHFGWAEAELSMVWGCGGVPDGFWDAYRELNPLEPGWQDRLWLLNIREVLSMVAHFGDSRGSLVPLRAILTRFS